MARLAITLSLIFSLFLLAHARLVRFPSAVSRASVTQVLPEEASLLPLATHESDNVVFVKPDHPEIFSESQTIPDETIRSGAVPLRRPAVMSFDLSFRPVNRRFPVVDRRPLRPRRHRCHHRHPIRGPHVRVPYGDDMIVARGGMRQGFPRPRGELGFAKAEEVRRGPEGQRAGEESGFRRWFWNIINGF